MRYDICVNEINIRENRFHLKLTGTFDFINDLAKPKLIMYFDNGIEDRRLPLVIRKVTKNEDEDILTITSNYEYLLDRLFWKSRSSNEPISMQLNLLYGDYYEEGIAVDLTPELMEQDESCFVCQIEGNRLVFTPRSDREKRIAASEKKSVGTRVKKVLNTVYHWISFVVALCLLPWFAVDALMATFGIIGYAGKAKKTKANKFRKFIGHINARLHYFSQHQLSVRNVKAYFKQQWKKAKYGYLVYMFQRYKKTEMLAENRVSFISIRRQELSGNFGFVYEKIKDDASLDIQTYLNTKDIFGMTKKDLERFAWLCATSKVILLDEYTPYIHYFDLRAETKVFQLWHACGAFKTFGFTRLGKPKGTAQKSRNHRNYDYVTVSSKNVSIWYAEGFGVSTRNIYATGVPRTDIFFDETYKAETRRKLYEAYPQLQGKKVILFAPTFRGHVRENAKYPMGRFKVDEFMDAVGEEYFLIIKHHPFVQTKHPIPEGYENRVLDLSEESELNDLLFVTDLIITDYSSLVFEASLLNIPMLFYTFDLKSYIKDRDFYFNFESFVPGRFFYTQRALEQAIIDQDLAQEKVKAFAERFFDDFDGKASERVAGLIYQAMQE